MVFSVWAAFVAGIVATLIMTGLIVMARGMGMSRVPAFELITGSMMSANRGTALVMGAMIHYIVMGTVVFGLIYAALFVAVGTASWLAGLIIGIIHGILVGMMMPMMPSMHPRMQQTPAAVGAAGAGSGGQGGDEVSIYPPGMFGANWGAMTPWGILMGHAVYGVVLALVYGALVT